MKLVKLKMRNGSLFNIEKYFKNNNTFDISWNWNIFGLGSQLWLGDARLYLQIWLGWIHLSIGICAIGEYGEGDLNFEDDE